MSIQPEESPVCVICGEEAIMSVFTVTNSTEKELSIEDCEQSVKSYCRKHDPTLPNMAQKESENT